MHDQPKYVPLGQSTLLQRCALGAAVIEGTVARGQLHDDELMYGGKVNGPGGDAVPMRVDADGDGAGTGALQHLLLAVPRPHRTRATAWSCCAATGGRRRFTRTGCATRPVGHFFDVMTNGFGAMPDYAAQIAAEDRWAIIAYIRALQLSEHATIADVPPADRSRIQ
jgi:hypothetical protein